MVATRSLRACRLISGWSIGDLSLTVDFPLSSIMAIHGVVRQDYRKGAVHPPAIFRWYDWWRLISLWTRSQSSRVRAPRQSSCLVCSARLQLMSSTHSPLFPCCKITFLSTAVSTDREDQSILCTWVITYTLYCDTMQQLRQLLMMVSCGFLKLSLTYRGYTVGYCPNPWKEVYRHSVPQIFVNLLKRCTSIERHEDFVY